MSVGLVDLVCLFFSWGGTRRIQIQGPVLLELKYYTGIIFLDRADAGRRRVGGRAREQPSATDHGFHLSARVTGLTGT